MFEETPQAALIVSEASQCGDKTVHEDFEQVTDATSSYCREKLKESQMTCWTQR